MSSRIIRRELVTMDLSLLAQTRTLHNIQQSADDMVRGKRVALTENIRGWHAGPRFAAGREFLVYCVQLDTRGEPCLWLALPQEPDRPRLGAWLYQVEWRT